MAEILSFHASIAQSDPSLHAAISSALCLITSALHLYRAPRELCLSFNGGKDSTVVLHLLRAALQQGADAAAAAAASAATAAATTASSAPPAPAPLGAPLGPGSVYFSGGGAAELPEVAAFMASTEARYGFATEVLDGFHAGLAQLVARPEAAGRVRGVLMGTRRGDPDAPSLCGPFSPTSPGWPPVMRVCPILDWSYGQVWAFLRGAGVPFCQLYARGHTSLGGVHDSAPNPSLLLRGGGGGGGAAYAPAWELQDAALERAGRGKRAAAAAAGAAQAQR